MFQRTAVLLLMACFPLASRGDEPPKQTAAPVAANHAEQSKRGLRLFKEHVRELLVNHCLDCHGGKSTKADFNLATREALLESGFVGAKADESYLMELVRHEAEPVMPFKADKLSDASIAKLGEWIDAGAPYDAPLVEGAVAKPDQPMQVSDDDRQFWAFQPLADVSPPKLADDTWSRTEIDRLVLSAMQTAGVYPNASADRRTLIRRASLDLLGLPPTPAEVEAFVNDPDPDAYPRLIDRLLESPHYGERWARHWMDVARFAESTGFEHDYDRPTAYHYRDFLISAFNEDHPWDQMVRWQLAGDELAPEEPLAWMATGFLAAGVFPTQITEAEFEATRYDELDDIVATTGVAFLGLSVGCARCHDHKFDPIPTRDYYAMAATFATTIRGEKELAFQPEAHQTQLAVWQQEQTRLTDALQAYEQTELPAAFEAWLAAPQVPERLADGSWRVLDLVTAESREGATLTRQADGTWLASGKNAGSDEYTLVAEASAGAAALRIEALTDPSMARGGPGRACNGNFALSDVSIDAVALSETGDAKGSPVRLVAGRATHQQNTGGLSVASSIDGDRDKTGWAVDFGGIGKDQAAVFEFEQPLEVASRLTIRLRFHVNTAHTLGHFRVALADDRQADFELGRGVPDALVSALANLQANSADALSEAERATLRDWFAAQDAAWRQHDRRLQQHTAARPKPDVRKVMVYSEGIKPLKHHADGRGYPHFYPTVHLLKRGDVKQKTEVMRAGALQVLPPGASDFEEIAPAVMADEASVRANGPSHRRSALANWITDPEAGGGQLLARVIVNRLWQHHLGRGIVDTPNDFGFQGGRPTHPELLDWLAGDLIDHRWQLKRLHKQIMTSAVYMQTTQTDEQRLATDIDNRWWWHFAPRRLEAEAIRDSVLAVSGRLDRTLYGPGSRDEQMRRRSVYFTIKRSRFIPTMQVFDWPEHLVSIGKRSQTAIAPQALALLNGSSVRSDAKAFAARVHVADGTTEQAITKAYLHAFARPPSATELAAAATFVGNQAARYGDGPEATEAALVDFCQALFCSNEFLYLP